MSVALIIFELCFQYRKMRFNSNAEMYSHSDHVRGIPYYFTEPKHHHLRMIWNLYIFTTTCCKNILKVSGPTPSWKPHYGISKFSIFLVYSCFSNPETLDKIRIFSSTIWNFSYFQLSRVIPHCTFRIWSQNSLYRSFRLSILAFYLTVGRISRSTSNDQCKRLILKIPLEFI